MRILVAALIFSPLNALAAGTYLGGADAGVATSDTRTADISIPSGTDLLIVVPYRMKTAAGSAEAPTSVTIGGVAMTDVGETPTGNQDTGWQKMYFYYSPASGTQTIVASGGSATSVQTGFAWTAYSGFAQTGQPDSHVGVNQTTTTAMNVTTTIVADSWFIGSLVNQGSALVSGYTNATERVLSNPNTGIGIYDSNGTVTAGSRTMTVNQSSSFLINGIGASFSLATASTLETSILSLVRSFFIF